MVIFANTDLSEKNQLSFLERVITSIPNSLFINECNNVWLKDPTIKRATKVQLHQYNLAASRLESTEDLDGKRSICTFGRISSADKLQEDSIIEKVCEVLRRGRLKPLSSLVEKDKVDGWRVRTGAYDHCYVTPPKVSWVYKNGFSKDGKHWTENAYSKEPNKELPIDCSIPFKTQTEAISFEESMRTNFYMYLVGKCRSGKHVPYKYLPFMEDYTNFWDDNKFEKFFKLTEEEILKIQEYLRVQGILRRSE